MPQPSQKTTEQIVSEAFDQLSKPWIDAIKQDDIAKKTQILGDNYNLTEDQYNVLLREVWIVLLQLDQMKNFPANIDENANFSKSTLDSLCDDVTDYIFVPIYTQFSENIAKIVSDADIDYKNLPPTPPPPAPPGTPQAGYGGTSDPYKEPTGE